MEDSVDGPAGTRPSEVLRTHREAIREAVRAHGVTNPRVFGSVARGTDTLRSDLDLVVTVPPGAALGFLGLAENLTVQLGIRVDVVSDKGLHGRYRQILEEAVPL